MAARTLVGTGELYASTAANWNGSAAIADGDTITAAEGQHLHWDLDVGSTPDTTTWTTGVALTLNGSSTDPGTLIIGENGKNGYLPIKAGSNIVGTAGTYKGRIAGNYEGTWAGTTPLPQTYRGVIEFLGTNAGKVDCQYIDVNLRGYMEVTNEYVRVYGTKQTVTGSASEDTLTCATHGWANATPLCLKVSGGSLPAPLVEDTVYFVVNTATDTFKLAEVSGGTAIDLTTDGSGTIEAYSGCPSGSATINVLDDVTGDAAWSTTAGKNRAVLTNDARPGSARDVQRVTLSTINAGTLVLSEAVDSTQYPNARLWLAVRNVAVRTNTTTSSQPIFDYATASASGGVLNCAIVSMAATNTTGYGYAVNNGTGHVADGLISGCNRAFYGVKTSPLSGTCVGNDYFSSGTTFCSFPGTFVGHGGGAATNDIALDLSGTFFGNTYVGSYLQGAIVSGALRGNYMAIANSNRCIISGTIKHNINGIYRCSGTILRGAEIGANTTDVSYPLGLIGWGVGLQSATQVSNYANGQPYWNCTLYDLADAANTPQPGYLRSWCYGGMTVTDTATIPASPPITLTYAHKMTFESATYPDFIDIPLFCKGGRKLNIDVFIKANQSGMTEVPRCQIIDPSYPFDHASSKLVDTAMADNTNWQTVNVSYVATYDRPLVLRVRGKNASGYLHWMFRVNQPGLILTGNAG